jgi:serine phosphatase RsbU (regulator of sigma subunit)
MDDAIHHVTIAVASRPHPNEDISGDGWSVHWNGPNCRITVIDGLGHGPEAAQATERARDTLDANPSLAPAATIHCCHDALVGTRGAAIAVASVSLPARTVTHSAIGNVEAQCWTGQRVKRLIAHRGIVGRTLSRAREEEIALTTPDWLLLMYSDGIRERFDLEAFPAFIQRDAQALADHILRDWSRATDDATVVVVMSRHDSVANPTVL